MCVSDNNGADWGDVREYEHVQGGESGQEKGRVCTRVNYGPCTSCQPWFTLAAGLTQDPYPVTVNVSPTHPVAGATGLNTVSTGPLGVSVRMTS